MRSACCVQRGRTTPEGQNQTRRLNRGKQANGGTLRGGMLREDTLRVNSFHHADACWLTGSLPPRFGLTRQFHTARRPVNADENLAKIFLDGAR